MNPIKLSLAAVLTALLLAPGAGARTLSDIKADGVLRVVTSGDIPPFSVTSGERHAGFEVELIEALAADLGVRVSYETVPMDQLAGRLQEDRADVAISGLAITSKRENKLDFTLPTLCAGMSVVSLDPKFNRHTDLVGRTIGVGAGTILQGYVQKLPFEKKMVVYPTNNDVVYGVITRAVDATFVYSVMQPALRRIYPKAPVHFGPELWSVPIGIMLSENSDSTRLALNVGLHKMFRDGRYAALSTKHFGKDVRCKA